MYINLEYLNIIGIIFLGIITSYQDFKFHKIKNKWILYSLILSIITIAATSIQSYYLDTLNTNYIAIYLSNILIAILIGFFLYNLGLWKPGDGKLLIAYSALIPIFFYKWGSIGYFPSYNLLINTFTPLFIYFLFKLIISIDRKTLFTELKKTLKPKLLLSFITFIFGFSWILSISLKYLGLSNNLVLSSIILLVIMIFSTKILNINILYLGIVFSMIRIIFFNNTFDINSIQNLIKIIFIFLFLRLLILNLGKEVFSKDIYIEDLNPGMSLVNDITKKNNKYILVDENSISFLNSIFDIFNKDKGVLDNYQKLSLKDIKKLKKLHSQGKIKPHLLRVNIDTHFAVFMFIGAILTILFQGNAILVIKIILESFI